LAIHETVYISYTEAVVEHIELMRRLEEVRYGVFDRALIESALARPQQAAAYDNADLPAQAATLCFGLIKNHILLPKPHHDCSHNKPDKNPFYE
jgi:prophage maintenance system killer protein